MPPTFSLSALLYFFTILTTSIRFRHFPHVFRGVLLPPEWGNRLSFLHSFDLVTVEVGLAQRAPQSLQIGIVDLSLVHIPPLVFLQLSFLAFEPPLPVRTTVSHQEKPLALAKVKS
ncbi:hypothetical protein EDB83DRAFT_545678 [Lactarius deliciosus]|nr:hypothetical protein EDB83DRAFT_545678 [Lactarius deliciosus]